MPRLPVAIALLLVLAVPASADAARHRASTSTAGTLTQLSGTGGCVIDHTRSHGSCGAGRALRGPGPFLGSEAIKISPDGRNVYVASSNSNAIAIFQRNASTGVLTQLPGAGGCIAVGGADGCATGLGLDGPNSVAVSPDGKNVYATSVKSDAVTTFQRNATTGALTQTTDGTGCVANTATTGCTTGRALNGPDVVRVSPDGKNVYVGAFDGSAVAMLNRNATTGALTQPAGTTGCLTLQATANCATGLALAAVEGLAISPDGANVYFAAAGSSAVGILTRNASTGALTQPGGGGGCIVNVAHTGCTTGRRIGGANAVTVSGDGKDVYATSLFSNTLTSFTRTAGTGLLAQQAGTAGCVISVIAVGCSLGHGFVAPEGLAVSPDGRNVYATSFTSGAVDVLNRTSSGSVTQQGRTAGCVATAQTHGCAHGRALKRVSSVAISSDGKFVYVTANGSDAVSVFRRN